MTHESSNKCPLLCLKTSRYWTVGAGSRGVIIVHDYPLYFPVIVAGPHERRLINDLMRSYKNLERPVANESEAVVLKFGLTLQQIMDVVSSWPASHPPWVMVRRTWWVKSENLLIIQQHCDNIHYTVWYWYKMERGSFLTYFVWLENRSWWVWEVCWCIHPISFQTQSVFRAPNLHNFCQLLELKNN